MQGNDKTARISRLINIYVCAAISHMFEWPVVGASEKEGMNEGNYKLNYVF
jgi:hypothetical protein